MKKLKKLLVAFFDPSSSVLLFILGTATLTLVLNASYDYFNDPKTIKGGFLFAGASLVVFILTVMIKLMVKAKPIYVDISPEQKPKKQFALALLVSLDKAAAEEIIKYHLPELHYCWLISTPDSVKVALDIKERYKEKIAVIYAGSEYIVAAFELMSTYRVAEKILTQEIYKLEPRPSHIMLDITGGTKPMTAGMVLAGFANQAPMEYTQAVRDEKGGVAEGAVAQPTLIEAYFSSSIDKKGRTIKHRDK
ncbi:MAG: hypothetical protein CVU44_22170 [Chloroflexi bacterium HGW-Chloroflexi-6]|nr:MAG: hypothetical protein CVU44_22170 [Chloroflexi bacterium HGW-Chloroflexi-6]